MKYLRQGLEKLTKTPSSEIDEKLISTELNHKEGKDRPSLASTGNVADHPAPAAAASIDWDTYPLPKHWSRKIDEATKRVRFSCVPAFCRLTRLRIDVLSESPIPYDSMETPAAIPTAQ